LLDQKPSRTKKVKTKKESKNTSANQSSKKAIAPSNDKKQSVKVIL